jgi:hypothetical protein
VRAIRRVWGRLWLDWEDGLRLDPVEGLLGLVVDTLP